MDLIDNHLGISAECDDFDGIHVCYEGIEEDAEFE